jgi:hypothetical protein
MARRYLFLCPDRTTASGGIAVIYDFVALLNRAGHDAVVVHNSAQAGYAGRTDQVSALYTDRMNRAKFAGLKSLKSRLAFYVSWTRTRMKSGTLQKVSVQADDVIVCPEFLLADGLAAFQDVPVCVFVQNPFSLVRAFTQSLERGHDPRDEVLYWFGMSEVCRSHIDMLDLSPVSYFPVSMKPEGFTFKAQTEPLITYMPRKRRAEAKVIVDALKRRGRLSGYKIEAIDGLPLSEVSKKLEESRIFISFLRNESLGFPAAEAMASGCIVIGFDGLGGAEFFNTTTGFPIKEGDVAAVVSGVERIASEYETDPDKFTALQTYASQTVRERYSVQAFEEGALQAWDAMLTEL